MTEWYKQSKQDVLKAFNTKETGLTSDNANKALKKYGENVLKEAKKESAIQIFLNQFSDMMVIILMIAAFISMLTGELESTLVIITVLVLNAILGTVQQIKAEKSLDSLKSLSSPFAKVIRDGEMIEINSKYIVVGDIMVLEAGDMVCADGRIIQNHSLQVNESSLTGESNNVDKKDVSIKEETPLADRVNMVYSGSLVTYGRANVVVTETGMNTQIGKIATLMNETKQKKTPLQESLDNFSKYLATGILVICAIVFVVEMVNGMKLMDAMLFAVALAVAAIPEALSSIVTIVQAMGTQKMAKQNAIIKNLSAVEALGCVSVICSDKTGTLTQNKMTVQKIYAGRRVFESQCFDLDNPLHKLLLYNAVLNNDSSIVDGKGIGDPTEYALIEMYRDIMAYNDTAEIKAMDSDYNKDDVIFKESSAECKAEVIHNTLLNNKTKKEANKKTSKNSKVDSSISSDKLTEIAYENGLRSRYKRKEEVPFDSDRKLMSSKYNINGKSVIFTKGAIDVLLERCNYIDINGKVRAINTQDKEEILSQNIKFSENGLRVLAFAYKYSDESLSVKSEYNYIFAGLISMIDPPRVESVDAVKSAKKAGIKTVMITGDHKITATAIASQIGIFKDGDIAVSGIELDNMSDKELDKKITKISVYARVSPENKIRIVEAWQRKGKVVSMTGDGVNDAPALKKADIGVAMGITGTEVSKDASSMILADDNFATIIKAVANGRTIYENIKNAILFLLSGNLSAIITVLYASLLALPVPFKAVQLLFINLVTDSLPALAIGMEKPQNDVLDRKPRNPKQAIMDKEFLVKMILQGVLLSISVIVAYRFGLGNNNTNDEFMACSMAFTTLTLARLFHGFNCRGQQSIFKLKLSSNWYSVGAFLVGVTLVAIVVFVPFMRELFSVHAMTLTEFGYVVGLAVMPTIIIQVVKVIRDIFKTKKD